jgi:hypothetical protein
MHFPQAAGAVPFVMPFQGFPDQPEQAAGAIIIL